MVSQVCDEIVVCGFLLLLFWPDQGISMNLLGLLSSRRKIFLEPEFTITISDLNGVERV